MNKQLSKFGKENPVKTIFIIALCHILLGGMAVVLGLISFAEEILLFEGILIFLANIFFLAFIFYPEKGETGGWFKYSYKRQKITDFLLVFCAFTVIVIGVNNLAFDLVPAKSSAEGKATLIVEKISPSKQGGAGILSKFSLKNVFKPFKTKLQTFKKIYKMRKQAKKSNGGQGSLIALTVLLALLLIYLIAILSCSLSCSGYEGFAIVVLLLGLGGVIWGSIAIIRRIVRKNRDKG